MMKLLLHTCCGPCTIFPLRILREAGHYVTGYFYRSNIHPLTECRQRQETLQAYAQDIDLSLIIQKEYDLEGFLRRIVFRENERCRFCYHARLRAAAQVAQSTGHQGFSTTLLYSKYQNHELIRSVGETVARETGLEFVYEDFRTGWKEGVTTSKQLRMYRQQYCGCVYSEKERFYR